MKTLKQQSMEIRALEVLTLVNQGIKVSEACRQVRIPRSTYYRYIEDNSAVLEALQEAIILTTRAELLQIIVSRVSILEKTIEEALSDDIKPLQRLAIIKYLEQLLEKHAETLRIECGAYDDVAAEVLAGPILRPGVSRYAVEPAKKLNDNNRSS